MLKPFRYFPIEIVKPDYDSKITDHILTLNHLKSRTLAGKTPPWIFFQIKNLFHKLESLGSARIEGNYTKLADVVENMIEHKSDNNERLQEISNMEDALRFIEENKDFTINRAFVSELHKIITKGLSADSEGCRYPGTYRKSNVEIAQSQHTPPSAELIDEYMDELFKFIDNKNYGEKYDLIKIAIVHHRFAWIHPFENGNGRTVRALTYAMLIQYGFNVDVGRILNPTAIFCNDRSYYYDALSWADDGNKDGMLRWCEYVCKGLSIEIKKIDQLLDFDYLKPEVLIPLIAAAKSKNLISDRENKVLSGIINSNDCTIKTGDLEKVLQIKKSPTRSAVMKKMKDENLILELEGRHYTINLVSGPLLRLLVRILHENKFIPDSLFD